MITTCSPRNAALVRSWGAKHVFYYNDAKLVEKIQEAVPDLKFIFDTIGDTSGKANTEQVTFNTSIKYVLVWTAFLKDHRYAHFYWPASHLDDSL